jgi:DNA helicase-2/ATP-dependent DNA helicase PcrA
MTLHNAKGLEFPYVFISGLEDGLFPMARAFDEPDQLEEERRLFYVGITRAEKKLYLTFARTRRRAGEVLACIPSSFLAPLPQHLVDSGVTPSLKRVRYAGESSWRGGSAARSAFARRRDEDHSGTWIDYSDAQDAPRFVKGERVRHPQFGRGTIRELSGFGQDLKAVIDFESVGRKKVIVRYANLQKEL